MLLQNGSVISEHLGSLKNYNIFVFSILLADGMLCLLAHWEWGHVLGIFFAWVAPSGPGNTALCPCPEVLHQNYVLAISRDVGKALRSMTFSPGLLTDCGVCVCACLCTRVSVHVCTSVHV